MVVLSTLPAVRRGRAWPPSSLPASVPGRASRAVASDEVALDRGPPRRGDRPAGMRLNGRDAPQWPGCASMAGMRLNGRDAPQWPGCASMAGMRLNGRDAPQWPGCASMAGMRLNGRDAPVPKVKRPPAGPDVRPRRPTTPGGATHDPLLDPGATPADPGVHLNSSTDAGGPVRASRRRPRWLRRRGLRGRWSCANFP